MVTDRATSSKHERRQAGRFATRLPVLTQRNDLAKRSQADRRAECRLQLCDFSLGGLRAESSVPLKVDERLTLHLPPVGHHPPVRLTGRVVHCHRREDRYSVGIAFRETDAPADRSPYRYLPRLFSMAADFAGKIRPVGNNRGKR